MSAVEATITYESMGWDPVPTRTGRFTLEVKDFSGLVGKDKVDVLIYFVTD